MKKWTFLITLILLAAIISPVNAEPLPPYVLLSFHGHTQQLPLSCESRSAVDLAAFWGVNIPELEFFHNLPKTDNPNTGFVGNVYERWGQIPPSGYGVHAEPVAGLLQAYGLRAEARYGIGLEGLQTELAAGRPVILWATPRMANQPVEMYTTSDGQSVPVIRYEHTVTAVGYTQYGIYVVDSANGDHWLYGKQSLLAAWDKLGQMSVVVYGNSSTSTAAAPTSLTPPPEKATITFQNPAPGATVNIPVDIEGTVQMPGFDHYEIWYAPGTDPAVWMWVSGPHPYTVQNGLLTPEHLNGLVPGTYTLRVIAYSQDDQAEGRAQFTVAP